jgi:hypothetical protein
MTKPIQELDSPLQLEDHVWNITAVKELRCAPFTRLLPSTAEKFIGRSVGGLYRCERDLMC